MRRRIVSGFSLIELMITVAIVALLAAVALPAYQNYPARAKMSESILALGSCRNAVTEIYQGAGSGAPGANNWGCESMAAASKYVGSITTNDNGMITVTLQNLGTLNGKAITMTPLVSSGSAADVTHIGQGLFGWRCGASADGTNVDPRYLPASCRS